MSSTSQFHFNRPLSTSLSGSSQSVTRTKEKEREKTPVPFVEEDSYTDMVLIVEGKRLHTSRTLLAMCSPVMARMLSSSGSEDAESGSRRELQLPGKCYEHVLELLYILHPAYQRKVTDQTSFLILPLAEEFQVYSLKQKCEETLLASLNNNEKSIKEDLLLKCLGMADEFKLYALWTKCLQLCSKSSMSFQSLQRCREYENLSKFLKSMLEAFKGNGDVYKPSATEYHSSRKENPASSLTTIVNERNMRRSVSHTQSTQTRY